jgi:hypothetical protein
MLIEREPRRHGRTFRRWKETGVINQSVKPEKDETEAVFLGEALPHALLKAVSKGDGGTRSRELTGDAPALFAK